MSILTYREYRYMWDLVSRKPFLTAFPLHLDVEITSRCNLRCEMCFQKHMGGKRGDLAYEDFARIVDEGTAAGLCALKLQSRGEALLHKQFVEFLAYAKQKGILDVHVTTNGLLLNREKIKNIVDNGLNLIVLSYDRQHADAASMNFDDYTAFLQEVVRLFHQCREMRTYANPEERLKIRVQTCIDTFNTVAIKKEEHRCRELFPEADIILVNPIYISHEDEYHLKKLDEYDLYPCSYLWQRLTIYADGMVTTCSRDYNCKFNRLGSIKNSTVKDLWHSPALENLRRMHLEGGRSDFYICARCENYTIHKKDSSPGTSMPLVYDAKYLRRKKIRIDRTIVRDYFKKEPGTC